METVVRSGLDEAGTKRDAIEQHVAEVLTPQGHVMLVTSRPTGINEALFAHFHFVSLAPLTPTQQEEAATQRIGKDAAATLLPYLRDKVPLDDEGRRITSNPLMLSMVVSIFEIRQGLEMPATVAELYQDATEAMLERGGAASTVPHLRRLLQMIFFKAQVAQSRVIEDVHLECAALELAMPEQLQSVREKARAAPFSGTGKFVQDAFVQVEGGTHKGKRGVLRQWGPGRSSVLADGTEIFLKHADGVMSSGMTETAFILQSMKVHGDELRALCETMSCEMRDVLVAVRERVRHDQLPLLSLLTADPLQLQSSHLSFQEYYAARQICEEGTIIETPPWQWGAAWANTLRLGMEMGNPFSKGLLKASGVTSDDLNLRESMGGHLPTAFKAVALMVEVGDFRTVTIGVRGIDEEGVQCLVRAVKRNTTLKTLELVYFSRLGREQQSMLNALRAKDQRVRLTP